jgi:rod shape determining protein RodA
LAKKQLVYFFVGFAGALMMFLFPIRKLSWLIPLLFWISILLLISVEFFGTNRGMGAQRWLEIPFVRFTIQPSEIMKPAFMLMLAYLIKNNPPPDEGYGVKDFLKLSFYILLPFYLIFREPDLGTALVLLLVGYGTLFVIGINKKIWITIIVTLALCAPLMYKYVLHDYQKKRITEFMDEKKSYQVQQAVIAIGSGGLYGKSKDEATQTHLKFLPIATSDFIFPYYVERFGFMGALILILLYGTLIIHLLSQNFKLKDDYFTSVFTTATALLIFIYMGVNIAMTIGYAPVVGLPLPFFSYGGTSFITFMLVFGIYENLITFRYGLRSQ